MDGLRRPRQTGQQLEPVDQLELAHLDAADGARRRAARGVRSTRSCAAWTASSTRTPTTAAATKGPATGAGRAASLFDCLELLHSATGGALDVYREPLIREIGRYICRAHIAGEWYMNFADASAQGAHLRRSGVPLRQSRVDDDTHAASAPSAPRD